MVFNEPNEDRMLMLGFTAETCTKEQINSVFNVFPRDLSNLNVLIKSSDVSVGIDLETLGEGCKINARV